MVFKLANKNCSAHSNTGETRPLFTSYGLGDKTVSKKKKHDGAKPRWKQICTENTVFQHKLKTMVLTEQDGARNFLSGGLLGHLPTAFPVVTEPTSRALAHQLKDLREIALTGIPFDRGKPNQKSQTSRAKRLR